MDQHDVFPVLARDYLEGRLSRRAFLRASTFLGMSGVAAAFLAACGSPAASGAASAVATAGATATAAPAATATAAATAAPQTGGSITVAAAQGISQLDPYKILFAWEEVLYPVLWDSLTGFEPGSPDVKPLLAESWTSSDDLKTWTFTLRQGVNFSNGKALTADDVVADINRAMDPATVFIYGFLFPKIAGARAVDPSHVEITLEEPSADVPVAMYKLPIMDPAAVATINEAPIGTGPFVVKEFVPEDHITLVRNDAYWGTKPSLDQINLIKAQDPTAAVTALRGGQIDMLWSVPWQDAGPLRDSGDAEIVSSEYPSAAIIVETDNTTPPFDNPKARQALVYATDKKTIIETAYAGAVLIDTTNQPIASNDPLFNANLPTYEFDLEKAKALFAEAGINEGDTLTFWTTAGQYPEWTTYAQIMQSDFAKIGITLDIKAEEINTWAAKFAPAGKSWPNLLVPNFYSGMPAPITLSFWVPGICECNYDNPTYNDLLKQAAAQKDPAKRKELLGQAQQIFGEEAPVVVIGLTSWPAAVRKGVTGIWEDPGATFHIEHAVRTG